jgi:hypothetical protein
LDQATGGDRNDWQTPVNTTSTDLQNALLTSGKNEGPSISDQKVLQGLGYGIAPNNGGGFFKAANAPAGATASVNAVPEPVSLSILALGAIMAAVTRRRTRRS